MGVLSLARRRTAAKQTRIGLRTYRGVDSEVSQPPAFRGFGSAERKSLMPSTNFSALMGSRHWKANYITFTKATGRSSVTQSSGNQGVVYSKTIDKSWVQTPNYRTIVKTGAVLPDNAYSYRYAEYRPLSISMRRVVDYPGYVDILEYSMPVSASGHVGSDVFTLSNVNASFKLIAKAKGTQFNLPVFLGEGRETVNMITGKLALLRDAVQKLRRGDLPGAARTLKAKRPSKRRVKRFRQHFGKDPSTTAANAWLELSYGWIPLLSSVYDAHLLYLERTSQLQNRIMSVRASDSKSWRTVEPNQLLHTCAANTNIDCRGTVYKEYKENIRMVWKFQPSGLNFAGQLGLLNPVEVAWELVPLSFVADWFLPIGDYFSTLDVPFRFSHVGGSEGRRIECTTTAALTSYRVGTTWSGVDGYLSKVIRVQRQPLAVAPVPKLTELSLDPELGWRRITSGVALLRQALLGLSRK